MLNEYLHSTWYLDPILSLLQLLLLLLLYYNAFHFYIPFSFTITLYYSVHPIVSQSCSPWPSLFTSWHQSRRSWTYSHPNSEHRTHTALNGSAPLLSNSTESPNKTHNPYPIRFQFNSIQFSSIHVNSPQSNSYEHKECWYVSVVILGYKHTAESIIMFSYLNLKITIFE